MIEQTIISHARQAVRGMRSYATEDTDEFLRAFHEAGALAQLGLVQDSGLSEAAIAELTAIDTEMCALAAHRSPEA